MRVFVLSTGRCGSKTFLRACQHLTNYTSGHESLSKEIGEARYAYSDNHIEIDNRLSWFLGTLDQKFGDEAIYIQLIRNREDVVNSFTNRWQSHHSIIDAFSESILKSPPGLLTEKQKLQICYDYYDTVNDNIKLFLKDKSNTLTIKLESIKSDFEIFYSYINAKGDLDAALAEFDIKYNKTQDDNPDLAYKIKLFIANLFNR